MLRVPVIASNMAEWIRLAASAINQLTALNDGISSGTYADDAAASSGGVQIGSLYRKPDGSVGWRKT